MDLLETENFGYKLATEEEGIKVFDDALDFSELESDYLDLLDLSSSGYVVCSNTKDVVLDKILTIEQQEKPKILSGFTKVTQVAFSYDQSQLFVVDDGILLAMSSDNFETPTRDNFHRQLELEYINSIRPSRQHNGILVLTNDKELYILQDKHQQKVSSGVSAFSWSSPEDKLITASGNTISFVSPDGKVSDSKQADDGLEAVSVISLGDKKILASFSNQEEDLESFALDVTSQSFKPVDISPAYADTNRRSVYYSKLVQQWIPNKSITFVISSKATAIDTIVHDDLKASLVEQINETERAQMPLDDEGEDATAVGLAVDLSHDKTKVLEVSTSVEEAIGVLPKLWCLTSMGTLVAWWVFAAHEVKENSLSLQRAQKAIVQLSLSLKPTDATVSEPSKNIPEPANPVSSEEHQKPSPAAPSFQNAQPAFGGSGFGGAGFGGKGTGSTVTGGGFGSSGFGNTGFGGTATAGGFGSTGFGSTGFGSLQASASGFGQLSFSSKKTSDATSGSTSTVSSNFGKFATKASPFGSTNSTNLIFGGDQKLIFGAQQGEVKPLFGDKKLDETKLLFGKTEPQKLIFGAPPVNQEEKKLIGEASENQDEKKPIGEPTENQDKKLIGKPTEIQEEKLIGEPTENQEKKLVGESVENQEQNKLLSSDQKLGLETATEERKVDDIAGESTKDSPISGQSLDRLRLESLEKPKAPSPFAQLGQTKSGEKKEESLIARLNDKKDTPGTTNLGKESSPFPELSSLSVDSKKEGTLSPFGKGFHNRQQSESKPAFLFDADKSVVRSSEPETSESDQSDEQESDLDTSEQPRLAGLNPISVNSSRKFQVGGNDEERGSLTAEKDQTSLHKDDENDEEWETVETPENRSEVSGDDEDEEEEEDFDDKEGEDEEEEEVDDKEDEAKDEDLINEYEIVDKAEAEGYINVPVEVELLSYGGLTSNVGSEQSIAGMVSKIYQETSGHLEILRENEAILGDFIDAHSYRNEDVSLEEPTQWTLGLASALKEKMADVPEITATNRAKFGSLDERLTNLQNQVRASQKLRIPLEKQLAQLKLLTENLESFSAKNRPLDSRSEMMRDELRRKVKNVQKSYNEALMLLMPLKAQAGTSRDTVKNLERAVVQLSRRINTKQAEVNKLTKDIQAMNLGEPRMIETKPLSTYDIRRKWHDYYSEL